MATERTLDVARTIADVRRRGDELTGQLRLIHLARTIADLRLREHEAAKALSERRKERAAAEREALTLLGQLGIGQGDLPIFGEADVPPTSKGGD